MIIFYGSNKHMSAAAILKLAQLQEVYNLLATSLTSPGALSPNKQHMLVNIQQLKTAMQLAAQINALLTMVSSANISCDQVNAFVPEDTLDERRAFCGTLLVDGKKKCMMKQKVCKPATDEAGAVILEVTSVTEAPGEVPAAVIAEKVIAIAPAPVAPPAPAPPEPAEPAVALPEEPAKFMTIGEVAAVAQGRAATTLTALARGRLGRKEAARLQRQQAEARAAVARKAVEAAQSTEPEELARVAMEAEAGLKDKKDKAATTLKIALSKAVARKKAAVLKREQAEARAADARQAAAAAEGAQARQLAQAATNAEAEAEQARQEADMVTAEVIQETLQMQQDAEAAAIEARQESDIVSAEVIQESLQLKKAKREELLEAVNEADSLSDELQFAAVADLSDNLRMTPGHRHAYHDYFRFQSQTDAETAANLIDDLLQTGVSEEQMDELFESMQQAKVVKEPYDTFVETLGEFTADQFKLIAKNCTRWRQCLLKPMQRTLSFWSRSWNSTTLD